MSEGCVEAKDKLILIVEDDESMCDFFLMLVKKEGFRTETVGKGLEVEKRISEKRPDLIMLDFMLPDKGGFEILRELQAGEAKNIPIMVITARQLDPQVIESILAEPNVAGFFQKPLKHAVFLAQLHAVLKTKAASKSDAGPWSGGWRR